VGGKRRVKRISPSLVPLRGVGCARYRGGCVRSHARIATGAAIGAWLGLGLGLAAKAEERVPSVQEQQRPAQGIRETERATSAYQSAQELQPLRPGQTVTYDDVLKNPDDVELNYLYAQSQIAAGDLRGAASTLERILLIAPDLARVRLLYAIVLYRLDNLSEAEREFHAVSQLPMDPRLREELEFYLDMIALRSKPTRYAATLAGGVQWDSNRNAGPSNGNVLFLDQSFPLVSGRKKSDWSGVMLAGLRATHDLGFEAGHQLQGGLQIYGQKQVDVTDLDLMAISGEAGGLYRNPLADVQPGLYVSYLNLGGESYVTTLGSGVRADHRFSPTLDGYARFRFDYEWFEKLDESPVTNERTGARVQGGIGAIWSPWPVLRLEGGGSWVHKDAREDFYTYTGPLVTLSATGLIGHGQFVIGSFAFEYDDYDGPEQIISDRTRRDHVYLAGLSYGVPMSLLLPFASTSRALRDTLLTLNATYLNERSTLENYQYDDWRFSVLWTKTFSF